MEFGKEGGHDVADPAVARVGPRSVMGAVELLLLDSEGTRPSALEER